MGAKSVKKVWKMDIFIIVSVGIIFAILAVLIAIFTKKKIGKIFIYAILGFVIGLPIGYILAPFVLSFYWEMKAFQAGIRKMENGST